MVNETAAHDGVFDQYDTGYVSLILAPLIVALISAICAVCTVGYIVYTIYWPVRWHKGGRRMPQAAHGRNQGVLWIVNILSGDVVQCIGWMCGFHHLQVMIVQSSPACVAQGFLIQFGDLVSIFFNLALAIHTCMLLSGSMRLAFAARDFSTSRKGRWILTCVLWFIALFFSIIGPTAVQSSLGDGLYFTVVGQWCWIGDHYGLFRLFLHHIWVLIIAVFEILLYGLVFYRMARIHRSKVWTTPQDLPTQDSSTPSSTSLAPENRPNFEAVGRRLLLYPLTFCITTVPLASVRIAALVHDDIDPKLLSAFAALLASGGFLNSVLYFYIRWKQM